MSWPDQSSVKVARVTLSSAQVLAIKTTGVNVVPAPGTGLAISPVLWTINYTFNTTPYTDGGGSLGLFWGTGGVGVGATITTAGFWDQSVSRYAQANAFSRGAVSDSQVANKPATVQQTTANPTGGDGTVTVTVAYMVVPVS